MLRIDGGPTRHGRRDFLRVGSLALGGLTLPQLLATDAAAASVGYTVPTRWYGDLGPPAASESEILAAANEWFTPGRIVIGHLNHDPATRVFGQLADLLEERGLTTVTLNDVFITEQHP